MATIRYMVNDVDSAITFYTKLLHFELQENWGAIAIVAKGDLKLWLSGTSSSAARPMPNGDQPQPGGWNRFVIEVDDLPTLVDNLRKEGVTFRNNIVTGPGGKQILVEDPFGNPIELFESA